MCSKMTLTCAYACLVVLMLALTGCEEGGAGTPPPADTPTDEVTSDGAAAAPVVVDSPIVGRWNAEGLEYKSVMVITGQAGGNVSGNVTFRGKTTKLTGTITGRSVSMRSGDARGTGTVRGNTMFGNYTCPSSSSTWTATLQ